MPRKSRTAPASIGLGHNSIDNAKLKDIIERVERLEQEEAELTSDICDVYAEAKSAGFDVAALRTIIKMRKQDQTGAAGEAGHRGCVPARAGALADLSLGRTAMQHDWNYAARKSCFGCAYRQEFLLS
jgi:uncharacterized protein (UPF0335 family)